jgi:hypothetical protein
MSEERLRELYQLALRQRSGGDRTRCVPLDAVAALAARRLGEAEALRVMEHVTACPDCLQEYTLLDALHAEPHPGRRPSRRLLLAASITLVIGAGLIWRAVEIRSPPDLVRGDGSRMVLVSPTEVIAPATRPTFVWRSGGSDARYRFELLRPDGEPVFSAVVADTLLMLPDAIPLESGVEYRWWVQASLPDGRQLSSAVQRLLVGGR